MLEALIGWCWWPGVTGAGSSLWLVLVPMVAGAGSLDWQVLLACSDWC